MGGIMKPKTYIFLKESDGHMTGCELVINKGLLSAGVLLYMFYNSYQKASKLVNLGKLNHLGVTLDCNYKCSSEEIYNIYNLEAKYNVNFLSKTTVAYHRNLGQTLELLNENNYKKALSEQCNIFVFESGQWKALVLQQYTEWILLNKFFANRSYFECICSEEINISVSWEELQNRIAWYMHLSKLPIDKCQLATKISLKDVLCEEKLVIDSVQIPFKMYNAEFEDYFIIVNSNFNIHYANKKWIIENIENISNAIIIRNQICFCIYQ